MKYLSVTLGLLSLFSSANAKISEKKLSIKTDMSIYGFHADSTQIHALKGGMRFGVSTKGNINNTVSYKGKINIFFEEGSHIALNNDSYQTATTYGIESGQIRWSPYNFTNFDFGVSRPQVSNSPLFINTPSIGLGQSFSIIDNEHVKLHLRNYQNVVSTNYISQRVGNIEERASYYILSGLDFILTNNSYKLEATTSYFSFNELNTMNAFESRYLGADVTGISKETAKFLHAYKGFNIAASLLFKNLLSGLQFAGEYIINTESEDTGLDLRATIHISQKNSFCFEYFENEANTLPSIVVSPLYGGTNRKGLHYGYVYSANKKSDMAIDFYSMETIKATAYQKNLNILFLEYRYNL